VSRKRILFCADGHAVHTHEWLRLLEGTDWDVHAFVGGAVPPCPIDARFHTLDTKAPNPAGNCVKPFWPWRRGVARVCQFRFGTGPDVESRRLAALIRKLRPDIVHSLRLQNEGYTVLGARDAIRSVGATWIVSLWGADLSYFAERPEHRERVREVLATCDYLTADCRRDLAWSRKLGTRDEQLYFKYPVPGNGGLDVEAVARRVREPEPTDRRMVLFPKAHDDRFHQFGPVLAAVRQAGSVLRKFRLVFLRADEAVRRTIAEFPRSLRTRCDVRSTITREETLDLVATARAMAAPSLFDGTPNVMLEAMATGAMPVMSPLVSIREWVDDGVNGLLADNEDPAALANALVRACTDDDLVRRAAEANRNLVARRAERDAHRPRILEMYEQVRQPPSQTQPVHSDASELELTETCAV